MLGSLHDTSTMPLAVATEVPGWVSTELGDEMSEGMNQTRSGMHLARLKQCLLLYVNAKFMDGVSFTSLRYCVYTLKLRYAATTTHASVLYCNNVHATQHTPHEPLRLDQNQKPNTATSVLSHLPG